MVDPIANFSYQLDLWMERGKDLRTLRTPRAHTHGLAAKSSPGQLGIGASRLSFYKIACRLGGKSMCQNRRGRDLQSVNATVNA